MEHRPRRRIPPIVTLAIAIVAPLPSAPSLDAQTASDGKLIDPLELVVVPFAGLPNVRGSSDQGALGIHMLWPGRTRMALSARYELRWTRDDAWYDAGSLDLVHRLAGSDTASVALTGGWARWDRSDYGTVGIRAALPMAPPAYPGASTVQLWFDLRTAFPGLRSLRTADPTLWGQVMLTFVLPVRLTW